MPIRQSRQCTKDPTLVSKTQSLTNQPTSEPLRRPAHPATLIQHAIAAPGSLHRADALQLQRTIGNRAVRQLVGGQTGLRLQPKLKLGPVDDPYEQEADHVAQQVVGQVSTHVSPPARRQELDSKAPSLPPVSGVKMNISPEVESSIHSARGGGQPLPDTVRGSMERALGADFGQVRIHTDTQADTLNRSLQARAFTTGQDIFFRHGEYHPSAQEGEQILAHELTHVVQQQGKGIRHKEEAEPYKETASFTTEDTQDAGTRAHDGLHAEITRAPTHIIQAFWVRRGNQYHWISDNTKKQKYIQTAQTRSTFWRPATRHVYQEPWGPGTDLNIDPSLAELSDPGTGPVLEAQVLNDLEQIHRTTVGAKLLMALATQMGGRTTIQPQGGIKSPVTQTEKHAKGLSSTIFLTPGDLDFVAVLKAEGQKASEVKWNPTPSDVALFHELVHAYHNLNGTKASGPVTKEQAIHEGDVGIAMAEYQATGLNAIDGSEAHQYADTEDLTENEYRDQTNRPHRDTYIPRSKQTKKKAKTKK